MRALHTAWFVAMIAEVFLFNRPFIPGPAALGVVGLIAGQSLRYAAIRALGDRWTVKIVVVPGAPPVTAGLFRRFRHPNYLGVILEIAFVPLIHTAWLTAVIFSGLNAWMLGARIRAEEKALDEAEDYERHFKDRPRFPFGG